MKNITFSHRYKKMPPVLEPTYLHYVTKKHYDELSEDFIKIDTETVDGQFYQLGRGWLLILGLWTQGHGWTTVRPWNPEKENYYRSLIGQEVGIVIDPAYIPRARHKKEVVK